MTMLTFFNYMCLLCQEEGNEEKKTFYINSSGFFIHLNCWKYHAGEDEIKDFISFDEWKNFAGQRWDLKESCVESADGTKRWYLDNEFHRKDGPAIEYVNGTKQWYLNGELLSEKEIERMRK